MMPPGVLDRRRTALVVIDVQEAFRPVIERLAQVVGNVAILLQGARRLGLPVVVSEQYPRGLGETVPEVAEHLEGVARTEKVVFSAAQADGFDLSGRQQALVCGIETHVCVSKTVHDLLYKGLEVQVVADAVSSRTAENHRLVLAKMELAGAVPTSTETALFEFLAAAGSEDFRAIQKLVM